jgi:hypothetical protein
MMRKPAGLVVALVLVAAACGGGSGGDDAREPGASTTPTPSGGSGQVNAQLASYDLAAGSPQRVIVGLLGTEGKLVSFGTVSFAFGYLGTKENPAKTTSVASRVNATWTPIPGQTITATATGPRLVEPSEGVGVYAAPGVVFDRPGFWGVDIDFELNGKQVEAQTQFEVAAKHLVVAAGDDAPRSENLLPGAKDAPAKAVDSRAEADGTVPDPELHRQTVAAAIGSGRPTMVVISTPVYCVSRFCGPITDLVQRLAQKNAGKLNFVHIEVWRNFEAKELAKAAADWIYRPGMQGANEPWVFLVGSDGKVLQRWDNVASENELVAAIEQLPA